MNGPHFLHRCSSVPYNPDASSPPGGGGGRLQTPDASMNTPDIEPTAARADEDGAEVGLRGGSLRPGVASRAPGLQRHPLGALLASLSAMYRSAARPGRLERDPPLLLPAAACSCSGGGARRCARCGISPSVAPSTTDARVRSSATKRTTQASYERIDFVALLFVAQSVLLAYLYVSKACITHRHF